MGKADERTLSMNLNLRGLRQMGRGCLSHDLGYEAPNILRSCQDLGGAIHTGHPPWGLVLAGEGDREEQQRQQIHIYYNTRDFS